MANIKDQTDKVNGNGTENEVLIDSDPKVWLSLTKTAKALFLKVGEDKYVIHRDAVARILDGNAKHALMKQYVNKDSKAAKDYAAREPVPTQA